jgi:hypothetical protein
MMFGSYPFPGNIIENNTVEFIAVYVKPGKPPRFSAAAKAANRLSRAEWLDLTQQVWFIYPEDVRRGGAHPAPFPEKLPARLLRLYTYGRAPGFAGEIVLDPFAGTGTSCAVAKRMGRRWIGIEIAERYVEMARQPMAAARSVPRRARRPSSSPWPYGCDGALVTPYRLAHRNMVTPGPSSGGGTPFGKTQEGLASRRGLLPFPGSRRLGGTAAVGSGRRVIRSSPRIGVSP